MAIRFVRIVAKNMKVAPSELLSALVAKGHLEGDATEESKVDEDLALKCWNDAHPEPADTTEPHVLTARDLVEEYRAGGLWDIDLGALTMLFPSVRRFSRGHKAGDYIIGEEEETSMRELLNFLTAVQSVLDDDIRALGQWDAPTDADLIAMFDAGMDPILFGGICGDEVAQSVQLYTERWDSYNEGKNPRFSVLLRLCAAHRAARVALLESGPGMANSMSVCRICAESKFTGADPAASFAQSRGDIWENMISGITSVLELPRRLTPDHPLNHPRHRAFFEEAERELAEFVRSLDARTSSQVSKFPDLGEAFKEQRPGILHDKRVELGLEED